ncbi:MAG: hypothetical protein ACO1NZ_05180 [Adhaeribacter sp.]
MTKTFKTGLLGIVMTVCGLLAPESKCLAQSKIKTSPLVLQPDGSSDAYQQRVKQKTLVLPDSRFIILTRKSGNEYALALYQPDLKKSWETTLPLAEKEDLEAFSQDGQAVLVLTHRAGSKGGSQAIYATRIDLASGKKQAAKKLFEAPASSRRLGTALSPDGSKLAVYQYIYQQDQLSALAATLFSTDLDKGQERTYSFRGVQGLQSARVQLDNQGNQYVLLVTHRATQVSVRRYPWQGAEMKAMDIQLGGLFDGRQVYLFDTFFLVQPDEQVYAAAICAEEKTGLYHSLKVVRFDFRAGEMKFAPEFRFSPQYLSELNKLAPGPAPAKRLEDIYLTDLFISSEKDVVVAAEKKYNEAPGKPFVAREVHLFGYDNYLNPTWHSVLNKHQTAPAQEGFQAISYQAQVFGTTLQVLSLENSKGKTDLYARRINLKTGASPPPQALGLPLNPAGLAYLKAHTAWLDEKTILAVGKSAKKPAWTLLKITRK